LAYRPAGTLRATYHGVTGAVWESLRKCALEFDEETLASLANFQRDLSDRIDVCVNVLRKAA